MSKNESVDAASMHPIVRRPICLCSVCGMDVFVGDDLIENKVYKCGELSYISLTHRRCESECEHCNGNGTYSKDCQYGNGVMAMEGDCSFCSGTGVEPMNIQAVRLMRHGKFLTVDVETTNGWIEVIRERDCGTTPISHICELAGLQKANRDACEQQSMADFLASGGIRASFTGDKQ